MMSMCRQIDNCANSVSEALVGTKGTCQADEYEIAGADAWGRAATQDLSPYVQEHIDLIRIIRAGQKINELQTVAESTLTAIMGRMSAYSGKAVNFRRRRRRHAPSSPRRPSIRRRRCPAPPAAHAGADHEPRPPSKRGNVVARSVAPGERRDQRSAWSAAAGAAPAPPRQRLHGRRSRCAASSPWPTPFKDRLDGVAYAALDRASRRASSPLTDEPCFVGFDAYQKVIAVPTSILSILASAPAFRPQPHSGAAVDDGQARVCGEACRH